MVKYIIISIRIIYLVEIKIKLYVFVVNLFFYRYSSGFRSFGIGICRV